MAKPFTDTPADRRRAVSIYRSAGVKPSGKRSWMRGKQESMSDLELHAQEYGKYGPHAYRAPVLIPEQDRILLAHRDKFVPRTHVPMGIAEGALEMKTLGMQSARSKRRSARKDISDRNRGAAGVKQNRDLSAAMRVREREDFQARLDALAAAHAK